MSFQHAQVSLHIAACLAVQQAAGSISRDARAGQGRARGQAAAARDQVPFSPLSCGLHTSCQQPPAADCEQGKAEREAKKKQRESR